MRRITQCINMNVQKQVLQIFASTKRYFRGRAICFCAAGKIQREPSIINFQGCLNRFGRQFFYNTYKLTNHQLIFKYLSSFLWYLTEYQRMIQIVYSRNQRSYRKCSCRLFLPITLGSYPQHKYLSSCFPCGPEAANIRWWKLWQDTSTVKTLGAKSSKLQAVV